MALHCGLRLDGLMVWWVTYGRDSTPRLRNSAYAIRWARVLNDPDGAGVFT